MVPSKRDPVEVVQQPFGKHAIIGAAFLSWLPFFHQSRVSIADFPWSVRVFDAHIQDSPIAIDVLLIEPGDILFVVGIGSCAAADNARNIFERPFSSIRIEPGDEVKRPGIQQPGDLFVRTVLRDELVEEVEHGCACANLAGVDVSIAPERGLVFCGPSLQVCRCNHPNIFAFVALSDGLELEEIGIFGGKIVEELRKLLMLVVPVEGDLRHDRILPMVGVGKLRERVSSFG